MTDNTKMPELKPCRLSRLVQDNYPVQFFAVHKCNGCNGKGTDEGMPCFICGGRRKIEIDVTGGVNSLLVKDDARTTDEALREAVGEDKQEAFESFEALAHDYLQFKNAPAKEMCGYLAKWTYKFVQDHHETIRQALTQPERNAVDVEGVMQIAAEFGFKRQGQVGSLICQEFIDHLTEAGYLNPPYSSTSPAEGNGTKSAG